MRKFLYAEPTRSPKKTQLEIFSSNGVEVTFRSRKMCNNIAKVLSLMGLIGHASRTLEVSFNPQNNHIYINI